MSCSTTTATRSKRWGKPYSPAHSWSGPSGRRFLWHSLLSWQKLQEQEDMNEIIFVVEDAPEGGYTARAVGESIFTEAETLDDLHNRVRDAVRCHFDEGNAPKLIRLHFVRDEVIAA